MHSHTEGLVGPSGNPVPPLFEDGLVPYVSNANQLDESGGKTLVDDASRIEDKFYDEPMPRWVEDGSNPSVSFENQVEVTGGIPFVDSLLVGFLLWMSIPVLKM
ncbi:hypothetical protein Nepgr_020355 [Nepenthes gracilis]|uniref:Uncharacterized protein n=1 Tax=Nepenthes gracilis TaxID=150966 RepID=A0AAD3SXH4_NEPGR|nr:hypothetical protein Nepgr_020355 [Nepenthes gracilis]